MASTKKTNILDFGIKAFLPRHHEIRKVKRLHAPSFHGFRVWPSSWLLMDFIKRRGLPQGSRVVDVGCGWGLLGIYCSKNHSAVVTCIDIDSEVFPYLHLHAGINNVQIAIMKMGFDDLTERELKNFDVLIGADICFWDTMVDSLKGLILRAMRSGIQLVLIADPGRLPVEELGRYSVENWKGEMWDWDVNHPHRIQGQILKISSPTY